MQQIVLISGQGGVGKTTCSNLLYEHLESVALIDTDAVIKVKPWIEYEKLRKLGIKNSVALINNYWEAGYQYIICPGLVWNQKDLDYLCSNIPKISEHMVLFWLHADKNVLHKRRILRGRDAADHPDTFESVDKIIGAQKPIALQSGKIYEIDTTSQSIEDITKKTYQLLINTNS